MYGERKKKKRNPAKSRGHPTPRIQSWIVTRKKVPDVNQKWGKIESQQQKSPSKIPTNCNHGTIWFAAPIPLSSSFRAIASFGLVTWLALASLLPPAWDQLLHPTHHEDLHFYSPLLAALGWEFRLVTDHATQHSHRNYDFLWDFLCHLLPPLLQPPWLPWSPLLPLLSPSAAPGPTWLGCIPVPTHRWRRIWLCRQHSAPLWPCARCFHSTHGWRSFDRWSSWGSPTWRPYFRHWMPFLPSGRLWCHKINLQPSPAPHVPLAPHLTWYWQLKIHSLLALAWHKKLRDSSLSSEYAYWHHSPEGARRLAVWCPSILSKQPFSAGHVPPLHVYIKILCDRPRQQFHQQHLSPALQTEQHPWWNSWLESRGFAVDFQVHSGCWTCSASELLHRPEMKGLTVVCSFSEWVGCLWCDEVWSLLDLLESFFVLDASLQRLQKWSTGQRFPLL